MKTVLFVPGFQEGQKTRDYQSTLDAITSKGYRVRFVPINWFRTCIDDWVKELDVVYAEYDPADVILAGFSFGSMTAFMSAVKRNPAELWLFSFSPYFSDDIPEMKRSWLATIGKRRTQSFVQLDFDELARHIRCKTLIVVGEIESKKWPLIGRRSRLAQQQISDSSLIVVNNADHDVTDPNYVSAISEAIYIAILA